MTRLKLPHADGRLAPYTLCAPVRWPTPDAPPRWNRVAFAAAHVVAAPLAPIEPWLDALKDCAGDACRGGRPAF